MNICRGRGPTHPRFCHARSNPKILKTITVVFLQRPNIEHTIGLGGSSTYPVPLRPSTNEDFVNSMTFFSAELEILSTLERTNRPTNDSGVLTKPGKRGDIHVPRGYHV